MCVFPPIRISLRRLVDYKETKLGQYDGDEKTDEDDGDDDYNRDDVEIEEVYMYL